MDFRVDFKLSADATQSAFNRQQAGVGSSAVEVTPMSSKRTDHLLLEQRVRSKAEAKHREEVNRHEDILQFCNHREQVVKANCCNEVGCLDTGNILLLLVGILALVPTCWYYWNRTVITVR